MTLTPAQKQIVRRMREGYRIHYLTGINSRVAMHGHRISLPTFFKLKELGIIYDMGKDTYTLTDLGRTIEL